ncbi:hypothetical protein ACLIX2_08945 [Proteus cibi]
MNEINALLKEYSAIITVTISLITFILGLIIGDKMAIGRDRRKEHNNAIAEIRRQLHKQKYQIERGSFSEFVTEIQLIESIDHLSENKKMHVRQAWINYCLFKDNCYELTFTDSGIAYPVYHRGYELIESINKLLSLLPIK